MERFRETISINYDLCASLRVSSLRGENTEVEPIQHRRTLCLLPKHYLRKAQRVGILASTSLHLRQLEVVSRPLCRVCRVHGSKEHVEHSFTEKSVSDRELPHKVPQLERGRVRWKGLFALSQQERRERAVSTQGTGGVHLSLG